MISDMQQKLVAGGASEMDIVNVISKLMDLHSELV
jgi:hypothetical protein